MQTTLQFIILTLVLGISLFLYTKREEMTKKQKQQYAAAIEENKTLKNAIEELKQAHAVLKAQTANLMPRNLLGEKYDTVEMHVSTGDYDLAIAQLNEIVQICNEKIADYQKILDDLIMQEKIVFKEEMEKIKNLFDYNLMIKSLKELIASKKIRWHQDEIKELIEHYEYLRKNIGLFIMMYNINTTRWGLKEIEITIINRFPQSITYASVMVSLFNARNNLLANLSGSRLVVIDSELRPGKQYTTTISLTEAESNLCSDIVLKPGHIEFKEE